VSATFEGKEYERTEISHFIQQYDHCPECKGWDEFYVGVQSPPINMSGQLLGTLEPTGIRLAGRRNHRRDCTAALTAAGFGPVQAARAEAWDEGSVAGWAESGLPHSWAAENALIKANPYRTEDT